MGDVVPLPGTARGPRDDVGWRGASRDQRITELFEQHYAKLRRLAALLIDDGAAAEEIVQEAFLRTFAGWWRVRQPERAEYYLRTSVVNLCRSRLRRRVTEDRGNRVLWAQSADRAEGRAAASAPNANPSTSSRGIPNPNPNPNDPERAGEVLVVLDAVRSLPDRQRETVVLRYYLDLSEAEIAETLKCAVGTVKSQLSKARSSLAELLSETSADAGGSGA